MKTQLIRLLAAMRLFAATGAVLAQDSASRLFGAFTCYLRRLRKAVGVVKRRWFGRESGASNRKGFRRPDALHPVAVRLMHNCWPTFAACALLTVSATESFGGITTVWPFPTANTGPSGSLLQSGDYLYGVTATTVFKLNTAPGSLPQTLHTFGYKDVYDGLDPNGHLVMFGNWLYGTCGVGGANGGTIFAVNINDDGFDDDNTYVGHVLNFGGGNDGYYPAAGLTMSVSGNILTLYGTTGNGGLLSQGTVFSINVNTALNPPARVGTSDTILHHFGTQPGTQKSVTWDGSSPMADLVLLGNWLYGTTSSGGVAAPPYNDLGQGGENGGTVFAVNTSGDDTGGDGNGYAILYSFTGYNYAAAPDQGWPQAGLLLLGNTLYGTTTGINPAGYPYTPYSGTLFAINLDLTGPIPQNANEGKLRWNEPMSNGSGNCGENPACDLIWAGYGSQSNPLLIGTAPNGGAYVSGGTVFTYQHNLGAPLGAPGAPRLVAYPLDPNADGMTPSGGLVGNGYVAYGTAISGGGAISSGSVFKFVAMPTLNARYHAPSPFGFGAIVFSWSDPPGVFLQSAPTLNGPWTNIVDATSPYTNIDTGPQEFFRLAMNLTNLPPLAPAVATLSTSGITTNGAILYGNVIPNGANATAWFQYGTTTNYGSTTPTTFVSLTNSLIVSNSISGLSVPLTYHYQVVASNSVGISTGADLTVTILPSVTTLPASFIEPTNYVLNGLVSPNGFGWDCYAYFQYGTTTNYGQTTSQVFVSGTNTTAIAVSNVISGLLPGTLYHYEFWGTFIFAVSYPPFSGYFNAVGGDLTFTTPPTITVDGTLDAGYGSPLATQTVNTGFGDSTVGDGTSAGGSELDAAYGITLNGILYLFFSGNLEDNGNNINVFISDGRAGQSTLNAVSVGNGSIMDLSAMNGSQFSPGFSATYALNINNSSSLITLNQYDLVNSVSSQLGSFSLSSGIGNGNLSGIQVGFNNLNAAGVNGNSGTAANPAAADAVTTGLELAIPLSVLGNPSGSVQVLVDINGIFDNYLSNQFLPGLAVGSGNLGGVSAGVFNFSGTAGQFITVSVP